MCGIRIPGLSGKQRRVRKAHGGFARKGRMTGNHVNVPARGRRDQEGTASRSVGADTERCPVRKRRSHQIGRAHLCLEKHKRVYFKTKANLAINTYARDYIRLHRPGDRCGYPGGCPRGDGPFLVTHAPAHSALSSVCNYIHNKREKQRCKKHLSVSKQAASPRNGAYQVSPGRGAVILGLAAGLDQASQSGIEGSGAQASGSL